MANVGKMRRDFVKQRMAKMVGGGTVESDAEKAQARNATTETLGAGAAAQQQILGQAAAANAAGAPVMAGALQKAAGDVTEKTQDAAVKLTGQAAQHDAAVRAQREGETLAATERLVAQRRQDLANAAQVGLSAAEILMTGGQSAVADVVGG